MRSTGLATALASSLIDYVRSSSRDRAAATPLARSAEAAERGGWRSKPASPSCSHRACNGVSRHAGICIGLPAADMGGGLVLPDHRFRPFGLDLDPGRRGIILFTALGAASSADDMARRALATLVVRLGYIFVAIGLPGLVNTIVKRWIGRERPSLHGPFAYVPFSWRPEFASFPSGHTTTAFAALVAIGSVYPRLRPLLWTYALLIAASRVAVTAHYPSDVLAGAATGAFGAFSYVTGSPSAASDFSYGADGSIRPKPAPSWRQIAKVAGSLLAV